MVLMAVIMGNLAVFAGVPAVFAIAIGFAGGVGAGLMNGLLITRVKLPPFITTLGTWSIFYALLLWLSSAQSIRGEDIDANAPFLKFFGISFDFLGARITLGSVLMVVVFLALWYMLNKTAWGRHVYAIGDDKEAAELAGIRTNRTLLSVYALSGFVCALAGWASIGRVGSISPQSFYEGNLQFDHRRGDRGHLAFRRTRFDPGRALRRADRGRVPIRAADVGRGCALAGLCHRLAHHHRRGDRPVDPEGFGMICARSIRRAKP